MGEILAFIFLRRGNFSVSCLSQFYDAREWHHFQLPWFLFFILVTLCDVNAKWRNMLLVLV